MKEHVTDTIIAFYECPSLRNKKLYLILKGAGYRYNHILTTYLSSYVLIHYGWMEKTIDFTKNNLQLNLISQLEAMKFISCRQDWNFISFHFHLKPKIKSPILCCHSCHISAIIVAEAISNSLVMFITSFLLPKTMRKLHVKEKFSDHSKVQRLRTFWFSGHL